MVRFELISVSFLLIPAFYTKSGVGFKPIPQGQSKKFSSGTFWTIALGLYKATPW
jgi:hypothetical protein